MKSFATLCLLLLSTSYIFSGTTGKISGKVNDAQTGDALVGVNVVIVGTTLGASTDIDGRFVIINIPPGEYSVRASILGYTPTVQQSVRINIDQTTELIFSLKQELVQGEEVVIVAQRPVVQKDVSSSRANIGVKDIEGLPVASVTAVVGLQAGIQGNIFRGGGADQTAYIVDGLTLRDERNNTPYTGISLSSVQDIQVQTGGFDAEYGNIRSGVVNIVTKEGNPKKYSITISTRYSPADKKHFGESLDDPNSYWIRPYVDPQVAWTGTNNGAWDAFTQLQYPNFEGWNSIAQKSLLPNATYPNLTPEAAQRLFLFQHRKALEPTVSDYDIDLGIGGPVPVISENAGNLRFFFSYRKSRTGYMFPLSTDGLEDYNGQLKITSDISGGMKLMVHGMQGLQTGTTNQRNGGPGMFSSPGSIALQISRINYADGRAFGTDYWNPSEVKMNNVGAKFTHLLNASTYYEISLSRINFKYNTVPGRARDNSLVYQFGNTLLVDEGPLGWEGLPTIPAQSTGIDGMRMSVGFGNSRDSSELTTLTSKAELVTQIDQYNQIKAGVEVVSTNSKVNYGQIDLYLPRDNNTSKWKTTPLRTAVYLQNKFEYEGMVANIGVRMDYSDPSGYWYDLSTYDKALSGAKSLGLDTLRQHVDIEKQLTFSPRIGVAFPVTEVSKLFFNYGHFRSMPLPENLFLVRRSSFDNTVTRLANPNNPLPKTVAYELGYEHSLFDEYLIRIAGYYKDVTEQTALVTYSSRDNSVSYSVATPNSYEDIRGFELTLSKNRGDWVTGFLNYTYMVSTSGRFGFAQQFENAQQQRNYELNYRETDLYQNKPIPSPYARASIDFFTPVDYGPNVGSIGLLSDWRLNLTGSWQSGNYFTWTGGGSIPGIQNNVKYKDSYYLDMRFSKAIDLFGTNIQLFMDVSNLLNLKNFSGYGYSFAKDDFNNYMKSLHLPAGIGDPLKYGNIAGDDQPGDVRKDGTTFTPLKSIQVLDVSGVPLPLPGENTAIYFDQSSKKYYEISGNAWVEVSSSKMSKILDDKSYIDMPNLSGLVFLNPRNIFWGVKLSLDF